MTVKKAVIFAFSSSVFFFIFVFTKEESNLAYFPKSIHSAVLNKICDTRWSKIVNLDFPDANSTFKTTIQAVEI